jgi:hypothetical protein
MTTEVSSVGVRVTWTGHSGRVTEVRVRPQAVWENRKPELEYHVLGDDGIPYVVAARRISRETPRKRFERVNPLDRKRCRHCGSLIQSGLQTTVHPSHSQKCELYPDNAWRGYTLVKLQGGE